MEMNDYLKRYNYNLPEGWGELKTMKLKADILKYMREQADELEYETFVRKLSKISDAKLKKDLKQLEKINNYFKN